MIKFNVHIKVHKTKSLRKVNPTKNTHLAKYPSQGFNVTSLENASKKFQMNCSSSIFMSMFEQGIKTAVIEGIVTRLEL